MSTAPRPKLRLSKTYLALAVALFGIEVLIALFFHDAFVRPILGDVLVVALVYTSVLTVVELRPLPAALGVLVFACAVELAQYARLVDHLGLRQNAVARVVIGTSYDPRDFLAYAAGAAAVLVAERLFGARRQRAAAGIAARDGA